jgi:3-oxoacyl-[acyl-carrier protein] reductase
VSGAGAGSGGPRGVSGAGAAGRTVLIAGASSASGRAAAAALTAAGARVVAVGSNAGRLVDVAAHARFACDLSDATAVAALVERVHSEVGPIDGLVHLVGGWRSGQDAEGWAWLEQRLVTTLRNTTIAFRDDLLTSRAGRLAIVSSTAVDRPTWTNANYAAAKAAAETWVGAVAASFTRAARVGHPPGGRGNVTTIGTGIVTGAAITFVVRALGAGEGNVPETTLAGAIAGMWDIPSGEINGARVRLGA